MSTDDHMAKDIIRSRPTTEPPAVDRESLFSAMTTMCKVLGMDQATAESVAVEHIGMWFNEGILLDAAAVRHEHGERIAKDHDEQADEYERLGYLGEDLYRACAHRARDLSPAPEVKL